MAGLTISSNNYAGKVAADIYEELDIGWDLQVLGLVRVEPDVAKTLFLRKLKAKANPSAAPVDNPTTANSTSTVTLSDRSLTVTESMILLDFNPEDLYKYCLCELCASVAKT